MAGSRRVTIGFQGGQTVAARLSDDELKKLTDALEGGGWQDLESEDGPIRMNLGQVVYVSSDADDSLVGFG
jgi:hypothetical protein